MVQKFSSDTHSGVSAEEFRKITKSEHQLSAVYPAVRPLGTTRLPLDGFSRNLIFEYFLKYVEKIQISLK